MVYTLQPRFYKAGYRPFSVHAWIQLKIVQLKLTHNIDDGSGGSDVGI